MTTPNTDLTEQIARALALTDDYDGCFERLDGTDPEEPMSTDEEDAQWWRKRAAAVLPIVDAAVKRGQAEALRGAADLIEDMRNSAQVAEVAAYVPGEVGRQDVIDSFDAAMEEPGDWLRSLADSGQADTYREEVVNGWLAEAWDEGWDQAAHDIEREPYSEIADTPNPYREETPDEQ